MELKFSPHLKYLENGTNILEKILQNPIYYLSEQENELLRNNLNEIISFKNKKNINIIDIGSSDGSKTLEIVKKSLEIYDKVRYIPIDKSTSSIKKCIEIYNQIINNNFEFSPIIGDYENILNLNLIGNNLILFLGSTIGNYNKFDARNLLSKYVLPNSRFICMFDSIPNKYKKVDTILNAYNIPEMINIDYNMIEIIRKKNSNINNLDLIRKIKYDYDLNAIIRWFESTNKKTIIQTEISYKYSEDLLYEIIKDNIILNRIWYSDNNYCFMIELYKN